MAYSAEDILASVNPSDMVWIAGLLAALFLAAVLLFVFVRRRLRPGRREQPSGEVFTLAELSEMLQAGRISQKEYDALKAKIIEQTR